MLDFRRADGTIKEKALYNYIKKHKDDPEVSAILSIDEKSVIGKYKKYLQNVSDETPKKETSTITSQEFDYENQIGESSAILDFKHALTEDELLKQHGYDAEKWKITKHQCSKWQNGAATLMSSKIFVKPRNILENTPDNIVARINKALKLKPISFEPVKKVAGKLLLVLPISDLHYGLISSDNSSDNVYNMQIAEERLMKYVSESISNVQPELLDTVLVTFGNDFFNCDNVQGTTAHGTPQDNEKDYFTVWDAGVRLGVSVIEYLLKKLPKAKIHVAGIQGNHDLQSSHAMTTALYYKYLDSDRVKVDIRSDEKSRYYYTYGENLIGFGHETKIKECHRIMSSECKDWSNYKYRTMFLGHLHKEEVLDTGALVVRRLPILSGKSIWTDSQGFMSHPRAQSFVFDAMEGLKATFNVEME